MKQIFLEVFLSVIVVLLPLKPIMYGVGVLIFFDLFTGIYASIKNGESFDKKKLFNTVSKMVLFQVSIISAFIIEKYIITQLPIIEVVAGFLSLVELQSISNNVCKITGISFFESIKSILNKSNIKIPKNIK